MTSPTIGSWNTLIVSDQLALLWWHADRQTVAAGVRDLVLRGLHGVGIAHASGHHRREVRSAPEHHREPVTDRDQLHVDQIQCRCLHRQRVEPASQSTGCWVTVLRTLTLRQQRRDERAAYWRRD